MKMLFLLFLTLPFVLSADPKCPEGFAHFKRTPTIRNNYTKDWCMGVFTNENLGNRERARSICISNSSMMSFPESQEEFDVLKKMIMKANLSEPIAIDGLIAPRCKARMMQYMLKDVKFNMTTEKGLCNIKHGLFDFDDVNTNPSFILSQFDYPVPTRTASRSGYTHGHKNPTFYYIADAMTLVNINYKGNRTHHGIVNLDWSVGEKLVHNYTGSAFGNKLESVICGRHPL